MNELSNNFQVTNEPLTIYAEVKQGYRAVVNADVTALVSIPKLLDPVEVRLLDNGAGKFSRCSVNIISPVDRFVVFVFRIGLIF